MQTKPESCHTLFHTLASHAQYKGLSPVHRESLCISRHVCLLLFSLWAVSDSFWPRGLQQARLLCPLLCPRVCSDSCPLSWWCHPTISSSVVPFSSRLHLSQHQGLFQWVGSWYQVASVGASASPTPCVHLTLSHGGGQHPQGGCTEMQPPAPRVGVGWVPAWAEPAGTVCVSICPVRACYSRRTLEGRTEGGSQISVNSASFPPRRLQPFPSSSGRVAGAHVHPLLSAAGAEPLTFWLFMRLSSFSCRSSICIFSENCLFICPLCSFTLGFYVFFFLMSVFFV